MQRYQPGQIRSLQDFSFCNLWQWASHKFSSWFIALIPSVTAVPVKTWSWLISNNGRTLFVSKFPILGIWFLSTVWQHKEWAKGKTKKTMKCTNWVKCTVAIVQQCNGNNISITFLKKKKDKTYLAATLAIKMENKNKVIQLHFICRFCTQERNRGMHENAPEPLNLFIPGFERGFPDFFP